MLAKAPNQDFSNPTLQIRAPASSGWYSISQTPEYIAFGKHGDDPDESFAAAVFLFRLPALADGDAFTEYVREGVIKDSPSDRFDTIEQSVQYSSERNYHCVRYHRISIDKKARAGFFRKKLRLENIALYCQHPGKPGLGFSVSYSHRGGSPDYNIEEEEAAAFIDSVQVASSSKTPELLCLTLVMPMLTACVSGAPDLDDEQERRLPKLAVYPAGQLPIEPYRELGTVTAADCSGAPLGGRVYGNVDRAMDTLKRKAVAMSADAIIDASCGAEPLLNTDDPLQPRSKHVTPHGPPSTDLR